MIGGSLESSLKGESNASSYINIYAVLKRYRQNADSQQCERRKVHSSRSTGYITLKMGSFECNRQELLNTRKKDGLHTTVAKI